MSNSVGLVIEPLTRDLGELEVRRVLPYGKRTTWWNFVSSDHDRMDAAKARRKAGGFEIVPGDEEEFIPLPED